MKYWQKKPTTRKKNHIMKSSQEVVGGEEGVVCMVLLCDLDRFSTRDDWPSESLITGNRCVALCLFTDKYFFPYIIV